MDCSKNQPCESLRALEQKVDGKFREYDGRLGDGEVSFAVAEQGGLTVQPDKRGRAVGLAVFQQSAHLPAVVPDLFPPVLDLDREDPFFDCVHLLSRP